VRAIYNDEQKKILDSDSVWCPYETFLARLESLAMTGEAYKAECVGENKDADSSMEINEDLKAVVGSEKK
jgi:hypothetical protein